MRWFLENARPLVDEEGTVRHILVSVQEVTTLEETRRSLEQSESTFRASQQLSPDGFAILRAVRDAGGEVSDFKFEYANPAAKAMVGVGRLAGRGLRHLLKSQDGAEARFNWYVDVLQSVRVEQREFEYRKQDSSTWVEASCMALGGERIAVGFHDITEARRAEERLRLVGREYRHRIKNMIAVASALVVQGAKGETDVAGFSEALLQRLSAMAAAQDILGDEERDAVTIGAVVSAALKPFSQANLQVSGGPDLPLDPDCVVPLTLVLNELATNAAKYGALSVPDGVVIVGWSIDADRVEILWAERGGPSVTPPESEGFGSKLLARVTRSLPRGQYRPPSQLMASALPWRSTLREVHPRSSRRSS
jgi:PAS domain S-box-containing protein